MHKLINSNKKSQAAIFIIVGVLILWVGYGYSFRDSGIAIGTGMISGGILLFVDRILEYVQTLNEPKKTRRTRLRQNNRVLR